MGVDSVIECGVDDSTDVLIESRATKLTGAESVCRRLYGPPSFDRLRERGRTKIDDLVYSVRGEVEP